MVAIGTVPKHPQHGPVIYKSQMRLALLSPRGDLTANYRSTLLLGTRKRDARGVEI